MRLKKRDLQAAVKVDLPISFSRERISAHGGLELFRRPQEDSVGLEK